MRFMCFVACLAMLSACGEGLKADDGIESQFTNQEASEVCDFFLAGEQVCGSRDGRSSAIRAHEDADDCEHLFRRLDNTEVTADEIRGCMDAMPEALAACDFSETDAKGGACYPLMYWWVERDNNFNKAEQ